MNAEEKLAARLSEQELRAAIVRWAESTVEHTDDGYTVSTPCSGIVGPMASEILELRSALEACQRERDEAVAERDVWRAKSEWAHEKLREMNVRVGTIKRELRRNPVNAVGRRPAGVDPSITNLREWYGYWRHLARSAMGTVRKLEPDWQRAATKGADDAGTGERQAEGAQEPPREEAS